MVVLCSFILCFLGKAPLVTERPPKKQSVPNIVFGLRPISCTLTTISHTCCMIRIVCTCTHHTTTHTLLPPPPRTVVLSSLWVCEGVAVLAESSRHPSTIPLLLRLEERLGPSENHIGNNKKFPRQSRGRKALFKKNQGAVRARNRLDTFWILKVRTGSWGVGPSSKGLWKGQV